jgi:hypothetical protein
LEAEHKISGDINAQSIEQVVDLKLTLREDIIKDDDFKYDGYQVVRGEFFAHIKEPSITFNRHKISINTACLNRLPSVDYVQILVNPVELKLLVRPSSEDEKDSFIWCSKGEKRRPKQVTCRVFFAKIMDLMGWNPDFRYKLLGKLIQGGDEYLFVFDLTSTEVYQRSVIEDGKQKVSRTPIFPAEWQNQFGLPVEEHRKRLQVDIFKGYAIFSVKENPESNTSAISDESLTKEDCRDK